MRGVPTVLHDRGDWARNLSAAEFRAPDAGTSAPALPNANGGMLA